MLRILSVSIVCLVMSVTALSGAEYALPVKLPADTGAVVRFAAPETSIKKVAEAADGLQKGWGNLVSGQSGNLGNVISNPTLAGVDKTKDWYIAVYPYDDGEPGILFIIPAKDVAEMEEAIPEDYEFIKGEGYGLYSEDEDVAKAVKESIAGKGELLKLSSGKGIELFSKMHLGIYLNIPVLIDTYEAAWESGVSDFMENMERSMAQAEGTGVNVTEIVAGIKKLVKLIEKAIEESDSFVAGLNLDEKSVTIHEFLTAKEGSDTQKYLQKNGAANPALISRLPAEKHGYISFTGDGENPLKEFMKRAVEFNYQMIQLDDDRKEKVQTLANGTTDFTFKENSMSFSLGDLESGVLQVNGLFAMKPADKWGDMLSKLCTAIGELEIADMKHTMKYEKAVETVSDHKIDKFIVTQVHNDENIAQFQNQMIKIMYGPDGNVNRFTTEDGTLLQSVGAGQQGIEKSLEAYSKNAGFSSGSASKRDRDLLQEKINFLGMIDLVSLVKDGLVIATQSGSIPIPLDGETIEKIKIDRSYLSVGISCENTGLHCQTSIPILQIKNGVKLGMAIQKMNKGEEPDF